MLEDEEALSHALPSWNGITLRWRGSNHLEEVLGNSKMLFLFRVLTNNGMDDSFEDVFLWNNALHVFNEIIGISSLIVFQVVDYQVESSLWDNIYERWKHLKSIFTASKNN